VQIESSYLSMRRGVFAAGANTYCTTKSSGYSEISASFSVTGSAGVASGLLGVFFEGLGMVAVLECSDVGVSHVGNEKENRTEGKVSKWREPR